MDGHSSHVNLTFLNKCDDLRIIVLVLPPHSTHRLQPLDFGLFGPLAQSYTRELNTLMFESIGMVIISKRMFWGLFKKAWKTAMTEENIRAAFAKGGIWPMNPHAILSKIVRPKVFEPPTEFIRTPMRCMSVRRVQRQFQHNLTTASLQLIFKSNFKLAAQHEIDEHTKRGLIKSLELEKKKRRRGKKLNLLGEKSGGAELFSSTTMRRARDYQKSKEDAVEQEKVDKAAKKEQQAAARVAKKQNEELQKKLRAEGREQMRAEKRAEEAAQKQAAKEKREAKKKSQQQGSEQRTSPKKARQPAKKKVVIKEVKEVEVVEAPVAKSSRGRAIKMPARFKESQ